MPTLPCPATSSSVRKARRRRGRRAATRHRSSVKLHSVSRLAQRSYHLEQQARDKSSHVPYRPYVFTQGDSSSRNSNAQIGVDAFSNMNRFSILDLEQLSTTLSRTESPDVFPAFSPELSAADSDGLSFVSQPIGSTSDSLLPKLVLRRLDSYDSDETQNTAQQETCSIASTPLTCPIVNIPDSYDHSGKPDILLQTEAYTGDFLSHIRIPSPLLYYRKSRNFLMERQQTESKADLRNTFSITCGQEPPEPDFQSYRIVEEWKLPCDAISEEDDNFVAAALPRMGRTNLAGGKDLQVSTSHGPLLEELEPKHATFQSYIKTIPVQRASAKHKTSHSRLFSSIIPDHQMIVPNPVRPWLKPQRSSDPCDLVFPKLYHADQCSRWFTLTNSPAKPCPKNGPPAHPLSIAPMVPGEVQNLIGIPSTERLTIEHPRQDRTSICDANTATGQGNTIEIAACPTPHCMALVPARFYQHQYLDWPGMTIHQPELAEVFHPSAGTLAKTERESEKIVRMVAWLKELGFGAHHDGTCKLFPLTGDVVSKDALLRTELEANAVKSAVTTQPEALELGLTANTSIFPFHDEGYFSNNDTGSEIDHVEADTSDDDWFDWDWDWDCDSDVIMEEVEVNAEGLGLFATN